MADDQVELTFFTSAMLRRWYLPVGLALIGLVLGLMLAPTPTADTYKAKTRVLLRPVTDSALNSNIRADQVINADTEVELVASDRVVNAALAALGDELPATLTVDEVQENLTVNKVPDALIMVINYLDPSPDVSAAMSNALADAYLEARVADAVAERDRQTALLASAIAASTTQLTESNLTIATAEAEADAIDQLRTRLTRLQEIVAAAQIEGSDAVPTGDPIAVLEAELAALPRTVTPDALAAATTTSELVAQQIRDYRTELVSLSTLDIDGGEVIDRAGVGALTAGSQRVAYVAIGALFGLMLGIMAAVTIERTVAARRAYENNSRALADYSPRQRSAVDTDWTRTSGPAVHMAPAAYVAPVPPPTAAPAPVPAPAPAPAPAPVARDAAQPLMEQPNLVAASGVGTVRDYEPAPLADGFEDFDLFAPYEPPAGSTGDDYSPPAPPSASGRALPVLADVPKIARSTQEPVVVTDPTSPAATSLRRLALLLMHDARELATPSIAIVSARPDEGKTTIATNVACAIQQEGRRVLLITDAHQSVIAPGVHVLPPGMGVGPDAVAPDDAKLHQLLQEARSLVDFVIIDTKAILTDADGIRVAAAADRALIVGVSGKTPRSDVDTATNLVEEAGTVVVGLATTERPNWLARRFDQRGVTS
jgi:uncharacterized protein involved in exopolysaccharide biosynthesis